MNQPISKRVGQFANREKTEELTRFTMQMVEIYGLEESYFLGAGSFEGENHHETITKSYSLEKALSASFLMSESADISIMKIPRYFDLTEIYETISIYYVLNGVLNISINYKTFILEKGNVIFIPPYTMQHLFINNDNTLVLCLKIRSSSFVKSFHNIMESGSNCSDLFVKMLYSKDNKPISLVKSPYDHNLKNILLNIMSMQYEQKKYSKHVLRNLTENFLLYLFSQYEDYMSIYNNNNIKYNELIFGIMNFLHENYASATLEDVAEKFFYSSAHISRLLYQGIGKGFKEIITDIRLNTAQMLLINTNLSIEDISYHIGYSHSGHLRHLFGKAFSMSPSQYRRLYSQEESDKRIS
jgi:AraC-like DNA-binding protein/mannose-6-phosphate isomerase-like protein (cupin superfamily)